MKVCAPLIDLILGFVFISFILIVTNQLTSPHPNKCSVSSFMPNLFLMPGVGFVSNVSFAAQFLSVTTQLHAGHRASIIESRKTDIQQQNGSHRLSFVLPVSHISYKNSDSVHSHFLCAAAVWFPLKEKCDES